MRARHLLAILPFIVLTVSVAGQQSPFLGKWNLTGTGDAAGYVYWLKIEEEGGQLTGLFLNRTSSPTRLAVVKVENNELVFQGGKPGAPTGPEYRAKLEGGKLIGFHMVQQGRGRGADPSTPLPPPRRIDWVGTRPPNWPAANANGRHTFGKPVSLFDGKTLDAFGVQYTNRPLGWTVVDGIAQNEAGANNLVSKEKFKDFRIEVEYKLGKESNSGIYLRGRYELQVFDEFGQADVRTTGHAAIYGHTAPRVNASKPIGEWQTMEAVIVANRVTVTLNGQRVHDNQIIEGITGGALDNDELTPGPLMIQGDHQGVWIRKIVVTPISTPGK